MGVVDNKVCAVDEDWSGLRFVDVAPASEARRRRARAPERF